MTALRSIAARAACSVRCIAVAYIATQVAIWHSFYAADPWRLTEPAAAVGWAVAYLLRRWPAWPLAGIDSAVYVALGLSAGWCVPPVMHGDAANWLFIAIESQLVVPGWFAPTAVAAPLLLASGAAYWAGEAATGSAPIGSGGNSPAAATVVLLAIAVAHCCGRQMLYRRASSADAALARADLDSREQYVVLSRSIERREHERLLHDTVLNTLTALARGGSGDGVIGRCRHDVTLMEYALSGPGDPADCALSGPGDPADCALRRPGDLARCPGRPYGALLIGIEAVAAEMRTRGLVVHVAVTGVTAVVPGAPADAGRSGGASSGGASSGAAGGAAGPGCVTGVPVPVAAAMAHAVREALANVISHAGTGEAWVEVSLAATGSEVGGPGAFQVTVRDAGVGFDPDGIDPARLGLRRSIIERVADWGGRASIRSELGRGTVVSLHWTARARSSREAVPVGAFDQAGQPW
jgi:hypothetical protein